MAKNKDKVETVEEKMARLQAEMLEAQNELAAEKAKRNDEIANKVNGLLKTFNVATLGDVINLIKQVEKGTLGKLDGAARSYNKLTDEQRISIKARLTKGEQVSMLANEFGVSTGTVYLIKKGEKEVAPVAPVAPIAEQIAAS